MRVFMLERLGPIISETAIAADNVLDWIPIASTFTNGVDILEKMVIDCTTDPSSIKNRYFAHINNKSYGECFLLMIPGVNFFFKVYQNIRRGVVSPNSVDPVIKLGAMGAFETFLQYETGQHLAHTINDGTLKDFEGGLYIQTIKKYRDNFESMKDEAAKMKTKDDSLLKDLEECNAMMQQYFQSCVDLTPTIIKNVGSVKVPIVKIAIKVLDKLVGSAVVEEAQNFGKEVSKLKKGEYKFDTVNLLMGNGFHTVSRVVICHEPKSDINPGKYDILVGNVGAACAYHPKKSDGTILPFCLENMTLDQVVDKQFTEDLIFNSTCGSDDPNGDKFYGTLINYAKKHKNIILIGNEALGFNKRVDPNDKKYQKYLDCSSTLQNMGNCIYKSPESLIKAVLKLKGIDPNRLLFMHLVKSWEIDFEKESPKRGSKLGKVYDSAVNEIQQQVKALAKKESLTEKEIVEKYCTDSQKKLFKERLVFGEDVFN